MKKNFLLLFLMCLLGGFSSSLLAQFDLTYNQGTKSQYTLTFTPIEGNECAVQMKKGNGPSENIDMVIPATVEYNSTTYTVVKIPNNAFSGASTYLGTAADYFTSLTIPNTVTTISSNAFKYWVNCTTVTLGEGVTSISNNAFANSTAITTIYCYAETPPTCGGNSVFTSTVKNNATVYVPANSIDDYKKETTSGYSWAYIKTNNFKAISSTPTAPDAPTLNSPADGVSDIFNPNLNFTLGKNTTHYQISIAEVSGTNTGDYTALTPWVKKSSNDVSYQTSDLKSNTTYLWKVVARNGEDSDALTAENVASFTTKQFSAPGQIEDAYPNGQQGLVDPEFTWTFGSDTEEYQVIIDGNAKTEWTNPGSSTTGSYQTSGLAAGEHTWRIDAKNTVGTTTGTEYTFTVASLPDNVTPVSPADGATGVTSNIVRFQFAPNTTEYRLLYSDTNTDEMGYISVNNGGTGSTWTSTGGATEMEFTIPGFGLGKTLYWAVDVKNSIGQRSVWNGGEEIAIYSFTVASTLPVANVAPENGTNNLENPVLSWNYKGNATHYMVYLGTEENNLTPATEWLARSTEGTGLAGSGSYQTTDLAAATQYFWRVDVKEGENSETVLAGDVWSFVTTLEAPVAQANPAEVVPSLGNYGTTTINWNKIETASGYNVYLGEEKLNAELITNPINYYEIPANSLKLNYNMNPGYDFYVEAYYGDELGSVMSEAVNVKVTGTGYFTATIYKNDYYNRLEGATITLSCTEDEFGNTYEEGDGEQYEYTTNSLGKAYYETITPDSLVEQVTTIRIPNGTYNVVVTKDNYTSYEGKLTFTNNEISELSVILTSENLFDVYLADVDFYSVKINLGTNKYGSYHVYRRNGNSSQEYLGELEFLINPGNESVSYVYNDWANLGKGNYLFGVSKIKDVDINWTEEVEIRNYDVFDGSGDWNTTSCWRDKVLPSENADVYVLANAIVSSEANAKNLNLQSGCSLTVEDGGALTITGTIVNNGSIVLNDGGQIFQSNENVYATFNMNMVNPTEWGVSEDGWQFIASPFNAAQVSLFTGLYEPKKSYDLYKYDGAASGAEWNNHKDGNFEEAFVNGRGYLASYQIDTIATLSGYLYNKDNFDFTEVTYTEGGKFANFHLLGNPFSFDMDWSNITVENVEEAFATVDPSTGGYIKHINGTIPVGDGFFVEATGDNPSISYNAGSKSRGEKYEYLNVIASGKQGSNNVIIKLSGKEERGFSKLENLNQSIADLYVKNNGRQYSVLGYDKDVKEVELFFDAKEMGNYSISIEPNGKFESVTLVDRMTGIETNMLLDSYTFTATANDNPNRFLIRLDNGQSATDGNFVYQSGEELIVNAEGSIQIIDMMGRMVYSSDAENSRINVSNLKGATYIVRNITDNDVKVQKVVIY